MSGTVNLIITGVGGQGIILASRILAAAALKMGYDVKVSEIHGMAQRGGSVVTHLRYGEQVCSPLVSLGEADFLVGFEKLEAIRCLPFLKGDGCLVASDQEILPLPVLLGKAAYPADSTGFIKSLGERAQLVPAADMAHRLGDQRVVNLILLGVLSRYLDIGMDVWEQAITDCVKPAYLDLNFKAFQKGRSWRREF